MADLLVVFLHGHAGKRARFHVPGDNFTEDNRQFDFVPSPTRRTRVLSLLTHYRRLHEEEKWLVREVVHIREVVFLHLTPRWLTVEVAHIQDWVEVQPQLVKLISAYFGLGNPTLQVNDHTLKH